jgi:TolB-like protein/AraC-like DNA-binding protein
MELNTANDQLFVKRLTEITEARLSDENFGVSELVDEMKMSRASIHRRIKLATGKSINQFIMETRLAKAFGMLQLKEGTVAEIAYAVGFGSATYFNKCFHNHYGISPGEVMKGNHHEKIPTQQPKTLNKIKNYLVLSVVSVFLVAVAVFFFFKNNNEKHTAKTIAVLPPVDNSPDNSKSYILEGFKEEVQVKLNAIKDLKITSSTTTEHYRNSNQTLNEIVKKLKVNYVIEISGQTIGDRTTIRVQLIEAGTDKHLWSESFEREISLANIFEIQNEIALKVANKLNVTITDDEKINLAKKPTEIPAAYNSYLQGLNYLNIYITDKNSLHYKNAIYWFNRAIELDSTFADAYCQMAYIYIKYLAFTFDENDYNLYNRYLDSGLVMLNKALLHDTRKTDIVYQLKTDYYQQKGMHKEALRYFEKLWENKRKNEEYYLSRGNFHSWNAEFYKAINNYLIYLDLKPETVLINQEALNKIAIDFCLSGFPEQGKLFAELLHQQHNDSIRHIKMMVQLDYINGNFKEAVDNLLLLYSKDTLNLNYLHDIMDLWFHLGNNKTALEWAKKYEKIEMAVNGKIKPDSFRGYLYMINGEHDKAKWEFEGTKTLCNDRIKYNNPFAQERYVYGLLSAIYAMQGDKQKALDYFKEMTKRKTIGHLALIQAKNLPIYDNISAEPEFREMIQILENKYLEEHRKIRKLLISRGMEPE